MGYLKASELGYELAQVNSAWMISKGLGLPSSITNSDDTSQGEAFPKTLALISRNDTHIIMNQNRRDYIHSVFQLLLVDQYLLLHWIALGFRVSIADIGHWW